MKADFHEILYDVEKAIDYAFIGKFVLNFYSYLKVKDVKKYHVEEFIQSTTHLNISELIKDLSDYIEGGSDNQHKQLREAYGYVSKPEARKIKQYLQGILDDAEKYYNEKQRRRKKIKTK